MENIIKDKIKRYIEIINHNVSQGFIVEYEPHVHYAGYTYSLGNFRIVETMHYLGQNKNMPKYIINNREVEFELYDPIKKYIDKIYRKQQKLLNSGKYKMYLLCQTLSDTAVSEQSIKSPNQNKPIR